MKAFIRETRTRILPFNDPVGETLLLDKPLREVQEVALRDCGLEPIFIAADHAVPTGEPSILLHDTLFFSPRLLREFIEKARETGATPQVSTRQLWLKKGLFTRLLSILQEAGEDSDHVAFPLWYNPNGDWKPTDAERVVLDVDEDSYAGSFPVHMIKKEGYRFCVTSRPVMAITHPLHLALANMAANFARLAELKKMSIFGKLLTLAKARSFNKFKILGACSQIHPEAEVHPTAVIEGSVVEKGAKIGAYAVIKFSHVGENAFIDDHAGLKFSIVGREAYIANNCVLFFTTVYPRAFLISGPFQFSLFGYDSALMNAIPSDYRLDGEPISVKTSRGVMSTGLRFVGSVVGHRTKIAAGVIIAPGRMIPNDLQILPDPARVIVSVPEGLPTDRPLFLIDGKLVSTPQHISNDKNKENKDHEPGHLRQGAGRFRRGPRGSPGQGHVQREHHRRPGE